MMSAEAFPNIVPIFDITSDSSLRKLTKEEIGISLVDERDWEHFWSRTKYCGTDELSSIWEDSLVRNNN